jgi:tetratricopeptide (TPR) repeat protein
MNAWFVVERGVQAPGPALLLLLTCGGALLVLIAVAVIAWAAHWARWPALVLGVLGLVPYEYALDQVENQIIFIKTSENSGNVYHRYSDDLRSWVVPGMVLLPLVFVIGSAACWISRNRLWQDEAPEHYKEGVHQYYRKNYEAALIEFTAGLKLEPQRADILCMRGCVFARLGAPDMALADLDRALGIDPHFVEAYLHRGRVRAARGEHDLALADFDHVLNARPADAECRLERGLCLERKGLAAEAVAEYEKILRLTNHPDFASPAAERLRVLGATGPIWPQAAPS